MKTFPEALASVLKDYQFTMANCSELGADIQHTEQYRVWLWESIKNLLVELSEEAAAHDAEFKAGKHEVFNCDCLKERLERKAGDIVHSVFVLGLVTGMQMERTEL